MSQHYSYQRELKKEQRYTYNGKESITDLDLDWLDFGARMYQADLGRWFNVDPMAEERNWVSPYNYVQNNPMNRIDPDGMLDIFGLNTETGDIELVEETLDTTDELIDSKTGETISSKVDKGLLADGQNIMNNVLETSNVTGGTELLKDISFHTNDEVGGNVHQNSSSGETFLEILPYEHTKITRNESGEVVQMDGQINMASKRTEFKSKDGSFKGITKYSFHTHPGHPGGIGNIGTAIPSGWDKAGAIWSQIPQVIFGRKQATYQGTTGNSSLTTVPSVKGTNGTVLPGGRTKTQMFNR